MKRNIGLGKVTSWEKPSKAEKQKRGAEERIRAAFQNDNAVVVIPAQAAAEAQSGKKLRVAAYCRVSTDEENQISSYELQIHYYQEYIERNPDWELAGIYARQRLERHGDEKPRGFAANARRLPSGENRPYRHEKRGTVFAQCAGLPCHD